MTMCLVRKNPEYCGLFLTVVLILYMSFLISFILLGLKLSSPLHPQIAVLVTCPKQKDFGQVNRRTITK